jgi:hypothetical protein
MSHLPVLFSLFKGKNNKKHEKNTVQKFSRGGPADPSTEDRVSTVIEKLLV